ncbi:MAG: DUF1186 domain-containing protein [Gammaproteobacteria bacterium]|jgi:hypothetical protein|nr:DUF1186 domain-containing protein [Gammaproteobacteria bacterium]
MPYISKNSIALPRRSPKKKDDIHTIDDILDDLDYLLAGFPEAAIEAAIEKQNEMIPILLDILDDALKDYDLLESDCLAPIYAMYLLAKFREKRAFPKIIEILELPDQSAELILGPDGVTDYGIKNIIASTFDGDLKRIYNLIEDRKAFEYSRSAGINVLLALYATNQISYESVIEYYNHLIHGGLEKPQLLLWSILACSIMDLYAIELYDPMMAAFNEGLVDTDFIKQKHFEEHFKENIAAVRKEWLYNCYHIIEDLPKEMSWWACFKEEQERQVEFMGSSNALSNRNAQKLGRNDQCHCGSGKKYKKCCLYLDEGRT